MDVNTIIIGAGITGLTIAQQLQRNGISYMLVEKAAVVGGRLSTETIGNDGIADTGAQFFTTRTTAFTEAVDAWVEQGVAFEYSTEWAEGSVKRAYINGKSRYAINGGMWHLADHLAQRLDSVYLNHKVMNINWTQHRWYVNFGNHNVACSENLIITLPPPQANELLSNIPLQDETRIALQRIYYPPNLTGVFLIDGDTLLPDSGGLQISDDSSDIRWVVDNKVKGISPDARTITIQCKRIWSKNNFARTDIAILNDMKQMLAAYLAEDTVITDSMLRRWEHSVPLTTHPKEILEDTILPVIFAGDAFGGYARIEGAYLSALTAGQRIASKQETVG